MNAFIARARNLALDGQAPDWIELLPAGPAIQGQDGRAWTLPDPQAVVAAFAQRHAALVVDWEHASEHRAPQGLDAPAAGWIEELAVRAGAIWGRVTWTAKAAAQIAAREYRYLSPVFSYRKDGGAIVELLSAGLTNQPNLPLTALNREESPVSLLNALHAALDLSGAPDEDQVLEAVKALKTELATARNRAETPPLDRFVPRADYDAVLSRASNAEQQLASLAASQRQARITALVERGLAESKIAPANRDYYTAMCAHEGGIEQFEAFLAKAPALLGADSGLAAKSAPAAGTPETEFATNAALRAEFGDVETYSAYCRAAANGRATILGSKA